MMDMKWLMVLTLALSSSATTAAASDMINISTLGLINESGLSAGFIIEGGESKALVVLAERYLSEIDPVVTVTDLSGNRVLGSNDNWQNAYQSAEMIRLIGRSPNHPDDAVLVLKLEPGAYVAIMRSDNGRSGQGLISVTAVSDALVSDGEPGDGDAYWRELENTKLREVCPPANFGGESYNFTFYCKSVTGAWNSGAFDTTRNRLLIWGGGHADYLGNEIYALDLNEPIAVHRLTDPAIPLARHGENESELAPFDGTQPQSRHTYDGMAYMAHLDRVWAFSGSLAYNGGADNVTWLFNPESNTWKRLTTTGEPRGGFAYAGAYDPISGEVFLHVRNGVYRFSVENDVGHYTLHAQNNFTFGLHTNAVIDPQRRKFIVIGAGRQVMYDIDESPASPENIGAIGGTAIVNANSPGLAFDESTGKIVAWAGGDAVYTLDLDTRQWQAINVLGGPRATSNGIYGRFAYVPSRNRFVTLNSVDANAVLLSLVASDDRTPPSTPRNFSARAYFPSQVELTWDASEDDDQLRGYVLYRDGVEVTRVPADSEQSVRTEEGWRQRLGAGQMAYTDSNLTPNQTYSYQITAYDSAGNQSDFSATVDAQTPPRSTQPIGDCSAELATLGQRTDLVFCEPFEVDNWWLVHGYVGSPHAFDRTPGTLDQGILGNTEIIENDCIAGRCLRVTMPAAETRSMSIHWPLTNAGLAPDRLYLRYFLKLDDNFSADSCSSPGVGRQRSGGKFPGIADTRTWSDAGGRCGNGGHSADGIRCFSARSGFWNNRVDEPIAAWFGTYLYHPNGASQWGDNLLWGETGKLERNRWYEIEMHVAMNTPGVADGQLRGWIDGQLVYERGDITYRRPGHEGLHARTVWLDIYKGGTDGNCSTHHVYLDQMVLALDRPVSALD